MEEIARLDHVYQYNELMGIETLHPLVSVIDMSKCPRMRHSRRLYGFYCIFLKDVKCGDLRYGRNYYDYQEGTLVFTAPGQVVGVEDNGEVFQPKGWALLFHPDLIRGTSLGRSIDRYTFFSYESYEALHLSEQERHIVIDCLQNIAGELQHSIDKHSRTLIVSNIELLLNYSIRFYERQFTTRSDVNKDALSGFERLLNDYFRDDAPQRDGVPSVRWCAEQLHLSANYFGDLVKKETGKSAQEYIQLKVIDIAKERMFDTTKSISEIAYELGFRYPQHFTRLFKKCVGHGHKTDPAARPAKGEADGKTGENGGLNGKNRPAQTVRPDKTQASTRTKRRLPPGQNAGFRMAYENPRTLYQCTGISNTGALRGISGQPVPCPGQSRTTPDASQQAASPAAVPVRHRAGGPLRLRTFSPDWRRQPSAWLSRRGRPGNDPPRS